VPVKPKEGRRERVTAVIAAALLALSIVAPVVARTSPGQQGYEGQPGNQSGG